MVPIAVKHDAQQVENHEGESGQLAMSVGEGIEVLGDSILDLIAVFLQLLLATRRRFTVLWQNSGNYSAASLYGVSATTVMRSTLQRIFWMIGSQFRAWPKFSIFLRKASLSRLSPSREQMWQPQNIRQYLQKLNEELW